MKSCQRGAQAASARGTATPACRPRRCRRQRRSGWWRPARPRRTTASAAGVPTSRRRSWWWRQPAVVPRPSSCCGRRRPAAVPGPARSGRRRREQPQAVERVAEEASREPDEGDAERRLVHVSPGHVLRRRHEVELVTVVAVARRDEHEDDERRCGDAENSPQRGPSARPTSRSTRDPHMSTSSGRAT